ncbi:protein-disulfide reductase DsbD domain-containing protein [Pararhodobacter sp.]|uniref:protein-disulfide reductase DsbD domain-containing protein n=1 Tax=Pararhodobacter sp. TaxID=2127056 RepID=UPI002AFE7337|nr:protein-disulfide reductase DsbD domain-containing protein [Pararhodobacter sp.]
MTVMYRTRRAALGTALSALALSLAPSGSASAQGRIDNPVVEAEILPGWTTQNGTRMAALRLILTPGWHTYWRIPGEAGIAPRLDWGQSQNVASVVPIWPRPEIIDQNGYRSYGYEDELILPLQVTAQDPGRPMALLGALSIGVCNETCVPADVAVQGVLRGAGERDRRISAALDTAARPGARAGLTRTTCRLVPEGRGAELTLRATLPPQGSAEDIILELPGSPYRITESRTWREGGELVAQATLRPPRRSEAVGIDRASIAFTVLSEERMSWSQGCTGG